MSVAVGVGEGVLVERVVGVFVGVLVGVEVGVEVGVAEGVSAETEAGVEVRVAVEIGVGDWTTVAAATVSRPESRPLASVQPDRRTAKVSHKIG